MIQQWSLTVKFGYGGFISWWFLCAQQKHHSIFIIVGMNHKGINIGPEPCRKSVNASGFLSIILASWECFYCTHVTERMYYICRNAGKHTCSVVEESPWSVRQTVICWSLRTQAVPICRHKHMKGYTECSILTHCMRNSMRVNLTWKWWLSWWSSPQMQHVSAQAQQWQGFPSYAAYNEGR